jgi:hypothetical protein
MSIVLPAHGGRASHTIIAADRAHDLSITKNADKWRESIMKKLLSLAVVVLLAVVTASALEVVEAVNACAPDGGCIERVAPLNEVSDQATVTGRKALLRGRTRIGPSIRVVVQAEARSQAGEAIYDGLLHMRKYLPVNAAHSGELISSLRCVLISGRTPLRIDVTCGYITGPEARDPVIYVDAASVAQRAAVHSDRLAGDEAGRV